MTTKTKVGLLWLLSCAVAGTLGWVGHACLRTAPIADGDALGISIARGARPKEFQLADADRQLLLVVRQGVSVGTLQSLGAYHRGSSVFYTNHHEDGTVKEVAVIFGKKVRRAWAFRQDGTLESETIYGEDGTGKIQFYDTSGKPAGVAGTALRSVD